MPITPTATLAAAEAVLNGAAFDPTRLRAGPETTERALETPWAAAALRDSKRILDIGLTFADADYLGLLLSLRRRGAMLEGADIVPPARVSSRYPAEWRDEILSIPIHLGDARWLALPEAAYDAIACISMIEHVGFDRLAPEGAAAALDRPADKEAAALDRDPKADELVLQRLAHALAPDGILAISVPMGPGGPQRMRDSLGLWATYWEYDSADWRRLLQAPGFRLQTERFFAKHSDGWREAADCESLEAFPSEESGLPRACGLALLVREH